MSPPWKPITGGLLGLVLGWHLAGSADVPSEAVSARAPSGSASRLAADGRLPDQITVEKSEVLRLLIANVMSRMTLGHYLAGTGETSAGRTEFTAWLGLEESQVAAFHQIFKQAVDDRLAWEKANARIREISSGEWEIHFPGDGGLAHQQLKDRLTEAFGPETVNRIEWGMDFDGFFNLQEVDPGFRHGSLRLRARQEPSGDPEEPYRTRVAVESGDKIVTFHLDDRSNVGRQVEWRLGRLIGGVEAIRANAPSKLPDRK